MYYSSQRDGYFESDIDLPDSMNTFQGYSEEIPASIYAVLRNDFKFPEWWE
jgi:hypothetical protein